MTKEQYIQEQLKKYKQADTEIQHHMLIIHLLGEIWELKEKANKCCEGGLHWGHSYSCKEVMD